MSSINWVGNRVMEGSGSRQSAQMPQQMINSQGVTADNVNAPPVTERGYIPYYLAENIGRSVRAEFIIGTSQFVDKTGILSEVGINYFVLDDPGSRTKIMCDLYSVKFVTILQV